MGVVKLRKWRLVVAVVEFALAAFAAASRDALVATLFFTQAVWMLWPITLREDRQAVGARKSDDE